jgi:hypothetical protein
MKEGFDRKYSIKNQESIETLRAGWL